MSRPQRRPRRTRAPTSCAGNSILSPCRRAHGASALDSARTLIARTHVAHKHTCECTSIQVPQKSRRAKGAFASRRPPLCCRRCPTS
eukprot:5956107-Prymnesium_polylepis.1